MSEELNMTPKQTLAFFASVIKSGEPWTGTCQKAYDEAMAALASPMTALTPAAEEEKALAEAQKLVDAYPNGCWLQGSINAFIVARALLSSPRVEEILKIVDEFRPPQPEASEFAKGANFAARQIYAAIAALPPSKE